LPRLAVLSVLSAASSPCPDLNLIHYIYFVLGLVTLVAQSAPLLTAVKIVGGLYLLYIGYKGLRSESCGRDGRNP